NSQHAFLSTEPLSKYIYTYYCSIFRTFVNKRGVFLKNTRDGCMGRHSKKRPTASLSSFFVCSENRKISKALPFLPAAPGDKTRLGAGRKDKALAELSATHQSPDGLHNMVSIDACIFQ